MFGPQLLVHTQLFLRFVLFAEVHECLPEPVMGVCQICIQRECLLVLRDGNIVLPLVRIKISELQMRLWKFSVQFHRLLEQHLDLLEVDTCVLGTPAFPQAHRIVIRSTRVSRLQFGKALKALPHFVCLPRRTVVCL